MNHLFCRPIVGAHKNCSQTLLGKEARPPFLVNLDPDTKKDHKVATYLTFRLQSSNAKAQGSRLM